MATGLSYYRARTEAFSTKIGLSSGAVVGRYFLCDKLPDFGRAVKKSEASAEDLSALGAEGGAVQRLPRGLILN